ncbi:MAG: hypothetical protein M3P33_00625, partial [bacterium]|nr:hypothetical protein [bacterium]
MAGNNKYAPNRIPNSNHGKMRSLLLVIFLFIFTLIYNLPKFNTNLNIFGQKITSIGGYNIDMPFFKKDLSLKKGLDLQGGIQLTLQADMQGIPNADREQALTSARDVIERRVNMYGVSEPIVQSSKSNNNYRIIVELPGVSDINSALNLVGKTAKLEFREPIESTSSSSSADFPASTTITSASNSAESSISAQIDEYLKSINQYKATNLTGKDLKKAAVSYNPQTGEPQVDIEFKEEGAKLFGELTKKYLGKAIAIYLDDQIISAPVVQTPILDGRANITGGFTVAEAQQFATQLNAGALPVPVSIIEQRSIGATLG